MHYPYVISADHPDFIEDVKINGYFDIRNETGGLKKYFKEGNPAPGINTPTLYAGKLLTRPEHGNQTLTQRFTHSFQGKTELRSLYMLRIWYCGR